MSRSTSRQALRTLHFKTLENYRLSGQLLVYYYQDIEKCQFKYIDSESNYLWQQTYWKEVGLLYKYSIEIPQPYLAQLGAKQGQLDIYQLQSDSLLDVHEQFVPVVAELFDFALRTKEYAVVKLWFL